MNSKNKTFIRHFTSTGFVINNNSTFEGRVRAVHVPPERAIDIDTLLDFQITETLLNIRGHKI